MKFGITMLTLLTAVVMLPSAVFAGEEKADVSGEREARAEAESIGEQPFDLGQSVQDMEDDHRAAEQGLLEKAKEMLPIIFGKTGNGKSDKKNWIRNQVKSILKNPDQYSEDLWNSLFGTRGNGISKEGDSEEKGKIEFVMELPDPVSMPDTYSAAYHRLDKKKKEIVTILERDEAGNIHYIDGENEQVFVRTDEGFRMYPVMADGAGFGEWDGTLLSARSVREKTKPFWNCADQTFIKWLGADFTEATEYLGRPCGIYHAEPGTITFTYKCDMVIDDETGVCLCRAADELLKGAVFNVTEDKRIQIDIGDYSIGGEEMSFYCSAFETENISFDVPEA